MSKPDYVIRYTNRWNGQRTEVPHNGSEGTARANMESVRREQSAPGTVVEVRTGDGNLVTAEISSRVQGS